MFAYLNGDIAEKGNNYVVIDVGGVGYYCTTTFVSSSMLGEIGDKAKVFTYLNVREDAVDLFAFQSRQELNCFKKLITVSGVGPKAGVAILSELSADSLVKAVVSGDFKAITKAQGVGPKLAQRVVLELKDKMADIGQVSVTANTVGVSGFSASPKADEAIEALVSLGYSANEAKNAVAALNTTDMTTEDIIRIALKTLF